jgi:hypothetical protein
VTLPILTAVILVALVAWYLRHRTVDVPCTIDLESTHDHLHAHVDLEGVAPEPGDAVLVHNAPDRIALGEVRTYRSRATVSQASWPKRAWTRLIARLDITELYDVGFE